MPGESYTFSKLDVKGLGDNAEDGIAKLWGEKPGKPFNPDYPEFFLKRVEEQNLFDYLGDTLLGETYLIRLLRARLRALNVSALDGHPNSLPRGIGIRDIHKSPEV